MPASNSSKQTRLLEAACCLFAQQGFHGTSTQAIARAAGVATGTLFHYYKTKEDLINAVYLQLKQALWDAMRHQQLAPTAPVHSQLTQLWQSMVQWCVTHPAQTSFLQQFNHSPYLTPTTRQQTANLRQSFYELFEAGITQGIVRDSPIELLHSLTGQQAYALARYLVQHPEAQQDSLFLPQAVQLLWQTVRV